jgi:hypothetical protein
LNPPRDLASHVADDRAALGDVAPEVPLIPLLTRSSL